MFSEACEVIARTTEILAVVLFTLLWLLVCYTLWKDATTAFEIEQMKGYIKRKEKEATGQPFIRWIK